MPVITRHARLASQSLHENGDRPENVGVGIAGDGANHDGERHEGLIPSTRRGRGSNGSSRASLAWSAGKASVGQTGQAAPDIAPAYGGRRGGPRGGGRKAGAAANNEVTGRGSRGRGGRKPARGSHGRGRGIPTTSEEIEKDLFYDDP